jgi:hypothetical protein
MADMANKYFPGRRPDRWRGVKTADLESTSHRARRFLRGRRRRCYGVIYHYFVLRSHNLF